MTVTLGSIRRGVLHGLGFEPDPSRHNLIDSINRAGASLAREFDWSWRVIGPLQMTVQNGQIEVPDDFDEMVSLTSPPNTVYEPVHTTLPEIMRLRRIGTVGGSVTFYWALGASTPDIETRRKKVILTAPVNSTAQAVMMIYKACWPKIELTANDETPMPIPDDFESALLYGARVEACTYENQTTTVDLEKYRAEVEKLKESEAGQQINRGPGQGGAGRFVLPGDRRLMNNSVPMRTTYNGFA